MLRIRFEMPAKQWILWRYGHGRVADAWILSHIATGIVGGFLGLLSGAKPAVVLSVATLVYFLYELWEAQVGIVEDVENALADVAAGAAGTGAVLWLDQKMHFSHSVTLQLFLLSGLVASLFLLIGWMVYLKRVVNKEVVRIYPSWRTARGRSKIRQDQVLFFGLTLSAIPLPVLTTSHTKTAYLWLIITVSLTLLSRLAVK